jgi:hypothetical protein
MARGEARNSISYLDGVDNVASPDFDLGDLSVLEGNRLVVERVSAAPASGGLQGKYLLGGDAVGKVG